MVANFRNLPIWHFISTAYILKILRLKSFFLGHLEYSSHILAEKILLIQENPKFSVIGRINLSFLIFQNLIFPTFLASQHPLGYLKIKIRDCLFHFYYFFKIAIVNSISSELQIVQVGSPKNLLQNVIVTS